jgi:hypothetical protein
MRQSSDKSRLVARLLAVLSLMISSLCCFCGAFNSFVPIISNEPLVLPSGEIASEEQVQAMAIIGFGSFATIALFIAFVGISIGYIFGRQHIAQKPWPRFFVILLGGSSLGCMLWGVLTAATAPLMSSIYPEQILPSGAGLTILGLLIGLIPAVCLALTAIVVWVLFIRAPSHS